MIPYDPFRLFREVQKEMDNMLSVPESLIAFSIQVEETADEFIAICKVPGLKRKEEMEVDVQGQCLTVGRNVTGSYEMKGENLYKGEHFYGSYRKTVYLPCRIRSWRTSYANGEFNIHMVKVK